MSNTELTTMEMQIQQSEPTSDQILEVTFGAPLMSAIEQQALAVALGTLPDDAHILEFGMGGSTIFLAQALKAQQRLFSVEHHARWYHRVRDTLLPTGILGDIGGDTDVAILPKNPAVTLVYRPTAVIDAERLFQYGTFLEENPVGRENYLNGSYGCDYRKVGLVFMDGVVRGPALMMLRPVLRPGTVVLLHDYAAHPTDSGDAYEGRSLWYDWAAQFYERVMTVDSMLCLRVPA